MRVDRDPCAVAAAHLEPAVLVLGEQREESVVGVLGDSPGRVGGRVGRVVEYPEQDRRVGGEVADEPVGPESECDRDGRHHGVGDGTERVEPSDHRRSESGGFVRVEVGAVEERAVDHPLVLGRMIDPEVEAFLPVRAPSGHFAVEREPAPPGAPAPLHRDLGLHLVGKSEERAGLSVEVAEQCGVEAMTYDAEEADLAAGPIEVGHGSGAPVSAGHEARDVDDRQVGGRTHNWYRTAPLRARSSVG